MLNPLQVQPGTRTLIAGKTGSGKSVFAAWLTQAQPLRGVVLDTKIDAAFERLPRVKIVEGLGAFDPADLGEYSFIVVRPLPLELDADELDFFLLMLYGNVHNLCITIDELYSVTGSGRAGEGLKALYTRGRSRSLSLIAGVQRPVWIPLFCISEADYVAEFLLQWPADRTRLAEVTVPELDNAPIDKFSFWWYKSGESAAVLHTAITPLPLPRPQPVERRSESVRLV